LDDRYRADWKNRTVSSFLIERSEQTPDAVAVIDGDVQLTYRDVHEQAQSVAAGLTGLGVTAGRSVLVQMPNWWESIVAYQAIALIGAVSNPVVSIYRDSELMFIIAESRPAAVLVPESFRGIDHRQLLTRSLQGAGHDAPLILARPNGPVGDGATDFATLLGRPEPFADESQPDRIALLMYTSGTTSAPKGVLHSHQTLVYDADSIISRCELDQHDTVFMPSPLTHSAGFIYGFLLPTLIGSSVVLLDVWDPATAVNLCDTWQCRFTVGATPFLRGMVEEHERRGTKSAIRVFGCGGADVPPELVRRSDKCFSEGVSRIYGSTEFPTFSWGRVGEDQRHRALTDGAPIGDIEYRLDHPIDGVGELLVRGPELFHGYLDDGLNADAFTSDGFFRTGDLASFDATGHVVIEGREKDIIIRNGENISAREVEDHLFNHDAVEDVAVVAVPDPQTGERACAVIVSSDPKLRLADLQAFLEQRGVAKQKWPERVELTELLPRTASGKIQKFLIRASLR
jgi:cyclohexanecarboxylate-CoA ligase